MAHRKITFAPEGGGRHVAATNVREAGGPGRLAVVINGGHDIPGRIRCQWLPKSYRANAGDGLVAQKSGRRSRVVKDCGEGVGSIPGFLLLANHGGIDLYVTHMPTSPQNINIRVG